MKCENSRYDSRNKLIALALMGMMVMAAVPMSATDGLFDILDFEYAASPDHIEPENGSDKAESDPSVEAGSTATEEIDITVTPTEPVVVTPVNPEVNLPVDEVTNNEPVVEIENPQTEEVENTVDEITTEDEPEDVEEPKYDPDDPLEHPGDAVERIEKEHEEEPTIEEDETAEPTEPVDPHEIVPKYNTSVIFVSNIFENGYLEIDADDCGGKYNSIRERYEISLAALCKEYGNGQVWNIFDIKFNSFHDLCDQYYLVLGTHVYLTG